MSIRSIERIIPPPAPHMVGDGFRVHNFIPGNIPSGMERMSPFIMLDYGSRHYFPPSEVPRGVGVHPHRGFETVTIAYHGKVAHHDSAGNSGVIGEGDVQWMTAASGVLHKEYHDREFSRQGGDFQMVQLWVNLPAVHKMSKPGYQAITNEKMGFFELADDGGSIEVIAGKYQSVVGPASTYTPVHLMNARLNSDGKAAFSFPAAYTTAMIVIEGSVTVNGNNEIPTNHFVLFKEDGDEITVESGEKSVVLIMSGEKIHEPIAAYGPFVMNSRDELIKAYQDLEEGKFGHLED